MPGKEEINHLAHRDLIGLRGKVKASLGSASRRDESAPDEQLQDLAVSAFETRIRSAIFCDCIPFPDSARQQSAFSADCNRLESQARPLDSLLSELIVRNVHNAVSGRAHKIM